MISNKKPAGAVEPEALRARGKRLTRARRTILDAVRASHAHPSAAAVYRQVRRRLPRVSLATVYRNLRMLAAEGLLSERADLAGMRFDGNTAPHDHFTCVECRRIYDVPALGAGRVSARMASRTGFEVLAQRIEFYGRCGACRDAAGPTRTGRGTGEPAEGAPTHRRGRGEPSEGAPTQRRKPWQAAASRAARASRT
jgi:Fur family ferric uptake transcriptional regulator